MFAYWEHNYAGALTADAIWLREDAQAVSPTHTVRYVQAFKGGYYILAKTSKYPLDPITPTPLIVPPIPVSVSIVNAQSRPL